MEDEFKEAIPDSSVMPEIQATVMPGLTATMEIAGVESIPGVNPDKTILGFSREEM